MRKLTLLLCCLMILFASSASALTLTWNELNDETYGATVGAHAFAEKLAEVSGGTMGIDLYINGQLGTEAQSMQGIQYGALDIFRGNASSLPDYGAEVIGTTGLPFLFKNMDEFEEMANSTLGQELLQSVEDANCGYIALAWLVEGPRNFFITQSAYDKLGKPDSFNLDLMKDLSIRVPGTELMKSTIQALGAKPIEIVYSALYDSLESGNIDGAENGILTYISSLGFSKAAPYFITDAHTFGCGVILMSTMTWESLSEEQQGWVREAAQAASDACYAYNSEQEHAAFDQFAALGITQLDVTDIEKWQEACKEVYAAQSDVVQSFVTRIQNHDF